MISAEHKLSLTRQAQLLDLSRASLYYTPVGVSAADLALIVSLLSSSGEFHRKPLPAAKISTQLSTQNRGIRQIGFRVEPPPPPEVLNLTGHQQAVSSHLASLLGGAMGEVITPGDQRSWTRVLVAAADLLVNPPPDPTGGALYYHSTSISRPWNRSRTVQIGRHVFSLNAVVFSLQ
jgi:hypothetical protein